MMMMKVGFIIVALLMVRFVSGEISTRVVSPSPSPTQEYSCPPQSAMSPSRSPSESESKSPTMHEDYINQPPSQYPEAGDLNHSGGAENGGGKNAGIAFGAIAAASMIGVGGYVLKKRRENIRRSRYEYAATEFL